MTEGTNQSALRRIRLLLLNYTSSRTARGGRRGRSVAVRLYHLRKRSVRKYVDYKNGDYKFWKTILYELVSIILLCETGRRHYVST